MPIRHNFLVAFQTRHGVDSVIVFNFFFCLSWHKKSWCNAYVDMLIMNSDEELATEVAWVVVYLSALSHVATSMLVKSDLLQILVERLGMSNSLQLLIPVR